MKFLMRPYSSDPDFNADCDFVVIEIDHKFARELRRRRKLFLQTLAREPIRPLRHFAYGDYSASFLASSQVPDELQDALDDIGDGYIEVDVAFEDSEISTECDELEVHEHGLIWTALLKHCDVQLSTPALPWTEIDRILAGPNAAVSTECA